MKQAQSRIEIFPMKLFWTFAVILFTFSLGQNTWASSSSILHSNPMKAADKDLPAAPPNSPIGFKFKNNERSVIIPMKVMNNLVVIPVTFNKILTLNLILDTGVKHTILFDHRFSPLFYLDKKRTITILGLGEGQEIEASIGTMVQVDIGEIRARNKGLLILPPESSVEIEKYMGIEVHGLIGFDLFKGLPIKIDYQNQIIVAYNPKYWKGKNKRWEELPIEIKNGKPYVNVDVVHEENSCMDCEMLIDSGSSLGLTFNRYATKKLPISEPNVTVSLGSGLSGSMEGEICRADVLDFKAFQFKEVICAYPNLESVRFLENKTEQTGSIGGEILSRFHCIFDYPNNRILLKKNREAKLPFGFNNSGMQVVAGGEYFEKILVDQIIPNSPADEGGIKVGDQIISLNALGGKHLFLHQAFNILESAKEGKTLRVKVLREGETKLFRIRMRSII